MDHGGKRADSTQFQTCCGADFKIGACRTHAGRAFVATLIFLSLVVTTFAAVKIPEIRAYEIGEMPERDIRTPIPLLITEFEKQPLVFAFDPNVTLEVQGKLRETFGRLRNEFLDNLLIASKYRRLTRQQAQHPGFATFVRWFQDRHKEFPLTANLAEIWATWENDDLLQDAWCDALAESMSPYLVAALPASSGQIHLITSSARSRDGSANLSERLGPTLPASVLSTIDEARGKLIRRFSPEDPPTGQFLAQFVKENCVVDANLSEKIAALARQENHSTQYVYEPGQVIVARGEFVDARAKAAIDLLRAKREQTEAEAVQTWSERLDSAATLFRTGVSWCKTSWQKNPIAVAGTGAFMLLTVAWLVLRRKKPKHSTRVVKKEPAFTAILDPARNETIFLPLKSESNPPLLLPTSTVRRALPPVNEAVDVDEAPAYPNVDWENRVQDMESRAEELFAKVRAGLAPHIAKEMMSEIVRRLISDRASLLNAHNIAAREIAQIEHRFSRVYAELGERLRHYQIRNAELERELAARSEQNRMLINAQIEALQKKVP